MTQEVDLQQLVITGNVCDVQSGFEEVLRLVSVPVGQFSVIVDVLIEGFTCLLTVTPGLRVEGCPQFDSTYLESTIRLSSSQVFNI